MLPNGLKNRAFNYENKCKMAVCRALKHKDIAQSNV